MKRLLKRLHTAQTRGQSLVEMAIIAPILIFFLLGIFEVGWALRNYLVLVNVNREITRFAVRPGYVDFSNEAARNISYQRVVSWTRTAASDQIALDFDKRSTLIVSHLVVDTGLPCEDMSTCQCGWFDPDDPIYNPGKAFTKDDIIIYPDLPNYEYQSFTYGITDTTGTKDSRIDYDFWVPKLTDENNKFNCDVITKGGLPSANNMIFTELFHDQPQLFGFPVISNPFTDPLPLYTHTAMRLIGGARATGGPGGSLIAGIDTIGEVCFAYPFIVSETQLEDKEIDDIINILDGGDVGGNHKGWVIWDPTPDENPADILKYQLQYPQMSVNSYHSPGDESDTILNEEDYVKSLSGAHLGIVKPLVDALIGKELIVPVWGSFTGDSYYVTRFIKVVIESSDITGPTVYARWVGNAPLACQAPDD